MAGRMSSSGQQVVYVERESEKLKKLTSSEVEAHITHKNDLDPTFLITYLPNFEGCLHSHIEYVNVIFNTPQDQLGAMMMADEGLANTAATEVFIDHTPVLISDLRGVETL